MDVRVREQFTLLVAGAAEGKDPSRLLGSRTADLTLTIWSSTRTVRLYPYRPSRWFTVPSPVTFMAPCGAMQDASVCSLPVPKAHFDVCVFPRTRDGHLHEPWPGPTTLSC
jgi:hypothetical protein